MIFINPKIDFAFKKIFGSEDSKDILISFLNALIYEEQPVIQDLEIINPYAVPKIRGVKDTYLDVKAKIENVDNCNHDVIIKMQVLNMEGFEKRILYNAAHSYSTQRISAQAYNPLNPVIALTITDFIMFSELNTVISRFILNERDFLVDHSIYDIELIFVELPKFKKQLSELKNIVDKWLFFLNETSSILEIPEIMGVVPEIKKAFDMASQANFTMSELQDRQKQEISIQDQRVTIAKAIQQGVQQSTIEIAKKMLNLIDEQTICQVTGLSLAELEALKDSSL